MSDKLKKFIDDNREAFDSETPDPKLFNRIQPEFINEQTGKFSRMKWLKPMAAAAVIIAAVSLYFIFKKDNSTSLPDQGNVVQTTNFPDPVYAKQIDQYQQMIDLQQAELKKVQTEHPDLYRQFSDDINQLDSSYRVLKNTLEKSPNTEVLLEAMIHNLQLQTELLNRQLLIIKEIKQKSKT